MSNAAISKLLGEAAFPVTFIDKSAPGAETLNVAVGMSLRDYFAGQELVKAEGTYICDQPGAYKRVADHCYRMADAMLEARKARS